MDSHTRFGQQEPNLWVKALTAATCSDKATQSCLAEILSAIGNLIIYLLCKLVFNFLVMIVVSRENEAFTASASHRDSLPVANGHVGFGARLFDPYPTD